MVLEDYKDIVAQCASIATVGQMLSGTLICKDMYKKGTSKGIDPMPFAGGMGMSILMLQFARIIGDPAMINVNIFGLLTNVLYMSVYYYYSPHTRDTVVLLGKVGTFVGILLAYAHLEHRDKVEHRFGIIATIILIVLIASPLVHLGDIIRTKNTDILPFPLIFMGTIVTFLWALYGIIIENNIIIFQHVVGFTLSVLQLSLFALYPSGATKSKQNQGKKEH